MTNVTMYFRNL